MDTIYFVNTYTDYHANGSNRAYWAKFFRSIREQFGEESKIRLYSSFNENMPIYEYYSESRGRFVRIMQYNPKDEMIAEDIFPAKRFFTAWIDKRILQKNDGEERNLPELVVCLLMTKENIQKAEDLIYEWMACRDDVLNEKIERIYQEQDKMDEELEK